MMKRGVYTHFWTKLNGIVSFDRDEMSIKRVIIFQVKGFRGPNLAKIMKTKMDNDEKRGLHTLWDKNEWNLFFLS
jgi:hypothetical protein